MLIRNYGLHWKREDVFWGRPKNPGHLLGVNSRAKRSEWVDFREQIGVYALYDDAFNLIYFGQVGSGKNQTLFERLRAHTNGHLAERWSMFSWFGAKKVKSDGELFKKAESAQGDISVFLDQMEAIVISVAEPPNNLQGGKFCGADKYIQHRDVEKLGPSQDEMIAQLYEDALA